MLWRQTRRQGHNHHYNIYIGEVTKSGLSLLQFHEVQEGVKMRDDPDTMAAFGARYVTVQVQYNALHWLPEKFTQDWFSQMLQLLTARMIPAFTTFYDN
jgi:hypothetical protein